MSMISAQIDGLRELAGDGSMEWVTCPIRASVLRDAADTIWQLRDDLQRANAENTRLRSELESLGTASYLYGRSDLQAENAKLREQVHYLMKGDLLHVLTDQEYIDQCERERLMQVSIDALDKENAKLRELVSDYEHCSMHADCDRCEYDGKMSTHCPLSPCFPDIDELNELGIEVNE